MQWLHFTYDFLLLISKNGIVDTHIRIYVYDYQKCIIIIVEIDTRCNILFFYMPFWWFYRLVRILIHIRFIFITIDTDLWRCTISNKVNCRQHVAIVRGVVNASRKYTSANRFDLFFLKIKYFHFFCRMIWKIILRTQIIIIYRITFRKWKKWKQHWQWINQLIRWGLLWRLHDIILIQKIKMTMKFNIQHKFSLFTK